MLDVSEGKIIAGSSKCLKKAIQILDLAMNVSEHLHGRSKFYESRLPLNYSFDPIEQLIKEILRNRVTQVGQGLAEQIFLEIVKDSGHTLPAVNNGSVAHQPPVLSGQHVDVYLFEIILLIEVCHDGLRAEPDGVVGGDVPLGVRLLHESGPLVALAPDIILLFPGLYLLKFLGLPHAVRSRCEDILPGLIS